MESDPVGAFLLAFSDFSDHVAFQSLRCFDNSPYLDAAGYCRTREYTDGLVDLFEPSIISDTFNVVAGIAASSWCLRLAHRLTYISNRSQTTSRNFHPLRFMLEKPDSGHSRYWPQCVESANRMMGTASHRDVMGCYYCELCERVRSDNIGSCGR